MDPNEALNLLRESAAETTHGLDSGSLSVIACEFAEVFTGLDVWLTQGGFLPESWQAKRINHRAMLQSALDNLDHYVEAAGEDAHTGPVTVRNLIRAHLQEG